MKILVAFAGLVSLTAQALPLEKIKLPDGFRISIYADNVPQARSLTFSPSGVLYVGTREAGNVYAVVKSTSPGQKNEVILLAKNLNQPNGVAFKDGSLYVAEIGRVLRYDGIEKNLKAPPPPRVVTDAYPTKEHHGWKYIRFGPDGLLYVPVGAPCNVCLSSDSVFASITKLNVQSGKYENFASGIRNTVGFDWDPKNKEMWFTDNGRDLLGDDTPPDELNHAPKAGLNFGFPYCFGKSISDPQFGAQKGCSTFTPPALELGPHVAALGMKFYTGQTFPDSTQSQVFIAEHGSWNRSAPLGYRITRAVIQGNEVKKSEIFAQGWLQNGNAWGRPVDIENTPQGSILVSDDLAGVIYEISYVKGQPR